MGWKVALEKFAYSEQVYLVGEKQNSDPRVVSLSLLTRRANK